MGVLVRLPSKHHLGMKLVKLKSKPGVLHVRTINKLTVKSWLQEHSMS